MYLIKTNRSASNISTESITITAIKKSARSYSLDIFKNYPANSLAVEA